MKHPFIWIIFSLVLIAGCADQEEKQQEEHASVEKPSVEYEVVADAALHPLVHRPRRRDALCNREDGFHRRSTGREER